MKEIKTTKEKLLDLEKTIEQLQYEEVAKDGDIVVLEQNNDDIKAKMLLLDNEVNELQGKLMETMNQVSQLETRKVEVDQKRKFILENEGKENLSLRIESLKAIVKDSILEYNDRLERFEQMKKEVSTLRQGLQRLEEDMQQTKAHLDATHLSLNEARSRKNMLVDLVENHQRYASGVRAIIHARKSLSGYVGVLGELIHIQKDYEIAITTALGSAMQFIIMENEAGARQAISFLRKNQAGRATFLPLTTMQARKVRDEHLLVLKDTEGYLGLGDDFIDVDNRLKDVVSNQLGHVIICDTLEHANEISKVTFARYKVVTLSGDVVNVGGSMTGGVVRQQTSTYGKKKELEEVNISIDQYEQQTIVLRQELHTKEHQTS